jgi:FtsZ-binding cell division protein ZapB
VTQDATDIETDIGETLRQVQIDSLRRLAERLRNELDEVRKDRDAWRSRAAKTAGAGWLRRLVG